MKRFVAVISAAILIFCCSITVFSFEIDGIDSGAEWKNTQSVVLFDGESNCNVNFGLVKWTIENETNTVYFCFKFLEPEMQVENINTGVSFFLSDSEVFTVTSSTSPTSYSSYKYSFDGAVSSDSNNGNTCEIKLGLKYGIPSEVKCKVRFVDSQGNSSNVYDFTVDNQPPETEETTEKTTKETTEKTTKQITTVKTTKKTVKTTAKDKNISSETSVAKTTKKSSSKTAKTTKKTKANTTKKAKTTKKKEYITDVTKVMTETNSVISTSTELLESINQTDNLETTVYKISTSYGKKYKIITAIVGGSVLLAVAILGSMKNNKKSTENDENDPKS